MHCNKVLLQELLDCVDNDLERIMRGILSIIMQGNYKKLEQAQLPQPQSSNIGRQVMLQARLCKCTLGYNHRINVELQLRYIQSQCNIACHTCIYKVKYYIYVATLESLYSYSLQNYVAIQLSVDSVQYQIQYFHTASYYSCLCVSDYIKSL